MNFLPLLVSFMLAAVSSAQLISAGNAPATVYFTPYKLANCSMSTNLTADELPSSYAVQSGHCYNSTYAFQSYVQATNFNSSYTPCALSIYPQTDCMGDGVGVQLSNCASCYLGPTSITGQSFSMACGP